MHRRFYVENKGQLDARDLILLQNLLSIQHVSGHHYAHHQELKNYTDAGRAISRNPDT